MFKLIIDSILTRSEEGMNSSTDMDFYTVSADLLVKAVLRNGSEILLIPEIMAAENQHPYYSIFEELTRKHAGEPVHMLWIKEFDGSSYMADPQHMTADGYGELARIIADHLIDSGLIQYNSNESEPIHRQSRWIGSDSFIGEF